MPTPDTDRPTIPTRQQIGTHDLQTWRVVPAECNPAGHPFGRWAIAAGDEEWDLYIEVADAEDCRAVAEFIVTAVHDHAQDRRHAAATHDIRTEIERLRAARHDAATPYHFDSARLTEATAALGEIARHIATARQHRRHPRDHALRRHVTHLAALLVLWLHADSATD
ncbi:hypothetical protein GCM10009677_01080 [Sphaerisporangium rubeum]|uniref:Uncharacterized protein n=1 Tax=Sphaerisporangium rubeum TaxID=321317 RepID=A0A7X0IIK9_9ACTN|nr:hypothetical protein [Sphaerisporangium rubeum]MBB6475329.1 hypothetical protein [Sphaerisporangium rubeum]